MDNMDNNEPHIEVHINKKLIRKMNREYKAEKKRSAKKKPAAEPKYGVYKEFAASKHKVRGGSGYLIDRILDPLEDKLGRFAIRNLMLYIIIGTVIGYILSIFGSANPNMNVNIAQYLTFDRSAILHGQVWRLITFVFLPESQNVVFLFFELYISYLIGVSLERLWGSFRFNAYYFIGVLGCIIGGFIAGGATNTYLNFSLFIAYALFFPEERFLIFFVIPVKGKWLALIDAAFMIFAFAVGNLTVKLMILFSIMNLLLFFGRDILNIIKRFVQKHR